MQRSAELQAFECFLRTGRRLPVLAFGASAGPLEKKFNPYHDPDDGRFTFASGGSTGSSAEQDRVAALHGTSVTSFPRTRFADGGRTHLNDGVYRPDDSDAAFRVVQYRPPPGIGSNSGAFYDPMTLDATFPGLRGESGETVAVADSLGFLQPGRALTSAMSREYSTVLIGQIKAIDRSYHYDSFGFPETFDGQMRQIDDLRRDRAAALYRIKGQTEPLQVETLRYLQESADAAYDEAMGLQKAGKLNVRLSTQEAIGNYVDQRTRVNLRAMFSRLGISTDRGHAVRVNGREYDSSGSDLTYRRPDARVGAIAYDVTIARKTLTTPQVRGFFKSDFKPTHVIIVRPSQLGSGSTYIITRQGR